MLIEKLFLKPGQSVIMSRYEGAEFKEIKNVLPDRPLNGMEVVVLDGKQLSWAMRRLGARESTINSPIKESFEENIFDFIFFLQSLQ